MALCERCQAEIVRPQDGLPKPWFNHAAHLIGRESVPPIIWRILEILWRRRGSVVMRETMMALLYGHCSDPPEERLLTVYIWHLRKRLTATPIVIKTEHLLGYRLIDNRPSGAP